MESNPKTLPLCFTSNKILPSVRVPCGLSYTRFTGTRVLGQFQETGTEYPPNHAQKVTQKIIQSRPLLI